MTNEEWLRSCTTAEFAKWCSRNHSLCGVCKHETECDLSDESWDKCPYKDKSTEEAWADWLLEKHENA